MYRGVYGIYTQVYRGNIERYTGTTRNMDTSNIARGSSRRRQPIRYAGQAVLIGIGVCAAVWILFELAERYWLGLTSSQSLAVLHVVRGLTVALLAMGAAALYLLRCGVPSLERSVGFSVGADRKPGVREDLVTWIIGLRWIAVFGAAGVVAFATLVSRRLPPESAPYLWAGVIALAIFNGALSLGGIRPLTSQRALVLQVAGDVAALGWLVHFAGGLQNPFSGFFVFHAAVAAVTLEVRQARQIAAAIGGFVLVLAALETSVLPPACLLAAGQSDCPAAVDWMRHAAAASAVAVAVIVCALLLSTLVQALRAESERLALTFSALTARTDELIAAQDRAWEERERLQMILDCMSDAVLYLSPDGKVRMRNRAAQTFWPTEAPEDGVIACHPKEKRDRLMEKVAALESIEPHPIFQIRGRSYDASYARVCDAAGTFRGVVMVARDVTERIEAQQWRIRGEQLAVVGKLAAALAHELNNPLGAIALFTQHALAEIDPQDRLAEYLGTVKRNANLCKKIVRDLLEYARQRPPERRQVALDGLLGDVVRTLEPHAQTSGVTIRCEFNTPRGVFADGDPDQLRQILVNLGLNSIEAMPNGGLLEFKLASLNGSVRIAVADTGIGIPPEEREHIFTAFHTTKPQGTGLGLAVARDLVAAHGGTIEFESARGQGSTFTITLPRAERAMLAEARL